MLKEILLGVASLISSVFSFIKNPSWGTFGFLAWDAGTTVAPGVPGSYSAKAVKKVSQTYKFAEKSSNSASSVSKAVGNLKYKLGDKTHLKVESLHTLNQLMTVSIFLKSKEEIS